MSCTITIKLPPKKYTTKEVHHQRSEVRQGLVIVCFCVLTQASLVLVLLSLSENQSLLTMPPWKNPSLLTAIAASFIMHFVILYFKITNVSGDVLQHIEG